MDLGSTHKKSPKKILWLVSAIIALAIFGVVIYKLSSGPEATHQGFGQVYALTTDQVSTGAEIVINLPKGVSQAEATGKVKFEPEIAGEWKKTAAKNQLVYVPKEDLSIGLFYSASLETTDGVISQDFEIVEKPKIVSVLPAADSETSENSEITVIFNRPMVPLTTLDKLTELSVPVELTPTTKGQWKWIGTRTLQFQPADHLVRSSNYKVAIKPEFTSVDGLKIAEAFESKFITRPLRYLYAPKDTYFGQIVYNEPFRLFFNQPVDLVKTKKELELRNLMNDEALDIIVEYGTKKENGKTIIDEASLLVYPKIDKFGREKFWDFANNYKLKIKKAYPAEGDIVLEESREYSFQADEVVRDASTSSERSYFTDTELFDPAGTLTLSFYEDIDLNKSKITADQLKNVSYGEKCKNADMESDVSQSDCEKVTDQSKLVLTFDSVAIQWGSKLTVRLESIYNLKAQKINFNVLEYQLKVPAELKIISIQPGGEQGTKAASLKELFVCTNSPLVAPSKEDVADYLKLNNSFKFKSQENSWRVAEDDEFAKCQAGEFQTLINYALAPETNYTLELKTEDVFGRTAESKTEFLTGKMESGALNFYHLQGEYSVTTPDKTKLSYAVENMDYVNLNICQLSAGAMLRYLNNKPSYDSGTEAITGCIWSMEKRLDLPKKYWDKNYFQVKLADYVPSKHGHFLLTFSNSGYRIPWAPAEQIYERSYVTITELGIVSKNIELVEEGGWLTNDEKLSAEQKKGLENIFWLTDLKTLAPLSGAKLEFYQEKASYDEEGNFIKTDLIKAQEAVTSADGVAKALVVPDLAGVIVRSGSDSALVTNYDNTLGYGSSAYNARKIYLYTDRPIYRPGDEVKIKGIYRLGYDGKFEIPSKKVSLTVRDSNWDDLETQELTLNDFGTFETTFRLDTAAVLGDYNLQVDDSGWANFSVEEYIPSPFKIDARLDKDEYTAGEVVTLDLNAEYYFGVPLESGEVQYTLSSQNYYFDRYTDEYFSFGSGWYDCYFGCSYGDKFILRNNISLDSSGKATIKQDLDFRQFFQDPAEQGVSKIFILSATVTNSNGQAVSIQKSFIVHAGDFYLGLIPSKYFLQADQAFNLKVKSVDTTGKELSVKNISLTASKVEWVYAKRKEVDGGYYYQWDKKLTAVLSQTLSTNGKGNWDDDLKFQDPGEYELTLNATDSKGNAIKSTLSIYVSSSDQAAAYNPDLIRPSNDTSLELVAEKLQVDPGETASFVIKNPYEKAKALITIERGGIYEYKIVDINQNLFEYKFEIKPDYVPNIFASVTLISDGPVVKYGQLQYRVNPAEKDLDIQIQSDKEKYLPGESVTLNFTVKDGLDQPVETELSVAVVDMSVLALKGNPKKNPLVFFYDNIPLTVSTKSNLKNILQEIDIKEGKGGGGGEAEKKMRGDFKDTAYWQGVLRTDASGQATLTFPLPDNLTTWQVESVGVTKDTKIGAGYKEFMARKRLMVTPVKPRFVVPGDTLMLGAQIFNQAEDTQSLTVSFTSETLSPKEKTTKISIPAGKSKFVGFNVLVPETPSSGEHKFILSAKNVDFEDTVEQTIAITPNDTYETVATAGSSKAEKIQEYLYVPENVIPEKGSLTINSSATLAVFLGESLNSLLSYPYGCTEQVSSKLEALAIVKRGLDLPNIGDKFDLRDLVIDGKKYNIDEAIQVGLAKIYENQNEDGGFAYYKGMSSNFYLTVDTTQTLIALKKAGIAISAPTLDRALRYIYTETRGKQTDCVNSGYNCLTQVDFVRAATVLADNPVGSDGTSYLPGITSLISRKLYTDQYLNEKIDNLDLVELALASTKLPQVFDQDLQNKIFTALANRVRIDARGAQLPSSGNSWWNYDTGIKNTALLLKALVAENLDNEQMDRLMRFLLRSRSKDGGWGSTSNTLAAIDAFTDYLVAYKENEADFTLNVTLDGKSLADLKFTPANILEQARQILAPLSEIPNGKLLKLVFAKTDNNAQQNNFYYDAALKYYLPINETISRDEGFTITRNLYTLNDLENKISLSEAKVGDMLRGHIAITVPENRHFVVIEDFIPAGLELINFNLSTENSGVIAGIEAATDAGIKEPTDYTADTKLYPDILEFRDDRIFVFVENLAPGTYTLDYYVRVLVPGKFNHLPAVISEMYLPENFGRTSGEWFEVRE